MRVKSMITLLCWIFLIVGTLHAQQVQLTIKADVLENLQLDKVGDTSDFLAELNLNFDSIEAFEIGRIRVLMNNPDGFQLIFETDEDTTSGSVTYLIRHNGSFFIQGASSRVSYQLRVTDITGGINSIIDNPIPEMPTGFFSPTFGSPAVIDFDGHGDAGIVNNHVFGIEMRVNNGVPVPDLDEGIYRSTLRVVVADS